MEYDTNFSYRFLYNLRHYAQHKGFPIGAIKWGQRQGANDPTRALFFLEVSFVRDEILNDFDWRALESEIQRLPARIDVLPHIVSFMKSLSRIHIKVINDMFQTLTDSAKQIITVGDRLAEYQGEPVVFEFEGDVRDIQSISHVNLPIDLAKRIVDGRLVDIFDSSNSED